VRYGGLVKVFGERVRDLRERAGFSQEELADVARLHRTAIGFIERGERGSTLQTIEKLAKALKVTPRELFPPFEG
jgi:transcriptional regulator with XRE-family HTH domain